MPRNEPGQLGLHQQSGVPSMQHVLARDLQVTGTGAAGRPGTYKVDVRGAVVPSQTGIVTDGTLPMAARGTTAIGLKFQRAKKKHAARKLAAPPAGPTRAHSRPGGGVRGGGRV